MKPFELLIGKAPQLSEIMYFESELYCLEGICHTRSDQTRALELIQKAIDLLATNNVQNPLPLIKYELEKIIIITDP